MRLPWLSCDLKRYTPKVSRPSAVVIDFERAFGESEKRGIAMWEMVVDEEEQVRR